MKFVEKQKKSDLSPRLPAAENLVLPAISLVALTLTFLVSISALGFEFKVGVFLSIIVFYLLFCAAFYLRRKPAAESETPPAATEGENVFGAEIERQLLALEEASRFFGAALKPADMFRLAASRINEMIPFASAALFCAETGTTNLKAVGSCGENARELGSLETSSKESLIARTLAGGRIEIVENLSIEKAIFPAGALKNLESAVAAPLFRNGNEVFAVLIFYGDAERRFDENTKTLLEAITERVAPLFSGSLAFEQSLSSALTDTLTNLPNERAFYLILENQMAESQRQRERRPLTILAVDAKKFADLNRKFGHATGDRILAFAAGVIRAQLRKMDFLARTSSDEFLIVLPTASESVAEEIVERIEKAFLDHPYEIDAREKIFLQLNFGTATYLTDGDTAQKLLESARRHKQTAKSAAGNVLHFPKQLVH